MHVHATKKKTKRQQTSKRDNKETKEAPKGEKKEEGRKAHKRANQHRKHTKGQTSMLSNKQARKGVLKGCPKRMNVGLDLVSVVPLCWSTDNTCAISKVPKRDSRSHVQKTGVNLHKIIGRN